MTKIDEMQNLVEEIVQTISSREVAEMMEIEHKNLLSKIDKINDDLVAENLAAKKYWFESSFENRGKQYREYQVTKLGCEFLAHKSTGIKGNLFTAKYMDKFNEMEQYIKEQQPQTTVTDNTKQLNAQARLKNAKVREANTYLKIADRVGIEKYKQIMCTYASKALSGQELIPLPKAERKTYSATEIGEKLGISANKVGSLANKYNLKTKDYGLMVWDKSRHSNKQIETFRYYDTVIEPLKRILEGVVPLVK